MVSLPVLVEGGSTDYRKGVRLVPFQQGNCFSAGGEKVGSFIGSYPNYSPCVFMQGKDRNRSARKGSRVRRMQFVGGKLVASTFN